MALVAGLIVNDEKSSFLKNLPNSRQSEKKHTQFETKMPKIDTTILIPFEAGHTYLPTYLPRAESKEVSQ